MAEQYTDHVSPPDQGDHFTALPLVEFLVKKYDEYQFLEIGTSDMTFMGRNRELSAYTPFYFSFTLPLNILRCLQISCHNVTTKSYIL